MGNVINLGIVYSWITVQYTINLCCCYCCSQPRVERIERPSDLTVSKLSYVYLLGTFIIILSFLLKLDVVVKSIGIVQHYPLACLDEAEYDCQAKEVVFRAFIGLAMFYAIIACVAACITQRFNQNFPWLKTVVLLVCLLVCLILPDVYFHNPIFALFSRVVLGFYMLIQAYVFIDFAYSLSDRWIAYAFEDFQVSNLWLYLILMSSFFLYTFTIIGTSLAFHYYGNCDEGFYIMALIAAMTIIVTVITLFRDKIVGYQGAVMPTSFLCAYCIYLCFVALPLSPDPECKISHSEYIESITPPLQYVFMIFSISWIGSAPSGKAIRIEPSRRSYEGNEEEEEILLLENSGKPLYQAIEPPSPSSNAIVFKKEWESWLIYYFSLTVASFYAGIVITDWKVPYIIGAREDILLGSMNYITMVVCIFITLVLFIWSLLAPLILDDIMEYD